MHLPNKRQRTYRPLSLRKLRTAELRILSRVTLGDTVLAHLFAAGSRTNRTKIAKHLARKRARAVFAERRALTQLQKRGLIHILERKGTQHVVITDTGAELYALSQVFTHAKHTTWDGMWRIVFFDIPNNHRELRLELRRVLERIGFVHMQQSVYVFPFAVPALEAFLRARAFPTSQVALCTVSHILNDTALRAHFKLEAH